jgi:hypothetical protein
MTEAAIGTRRELYLPHSPELEVTMDLTDRSFGYIFGLYRI